MRASVCATNSASTQPVSRFVPEPLPQTSSGPENVVLLAASWQLRFVIVGSRMENVVPECVVLSGSGGGPFQLPVPVPCMTCSVAFNTAPVAASTSTDSRLYPSAPVPVSVVSQANFAAPSSAYTTSVVPSTPLTVVSCLRATASASALDTRGITDMLPIGRLCATEVNFVWPVTSVTTTKSPPTTRRPLYVRSNGTYRV